jgi:hypothetical protein
MLWIVTSKVGQLISCSKYSKLPNVNLESTHLTDFQRLSRLLMITALAFQFFLSHHPKIDPCFFVMYLGLFYFFCLNASTNPSFAIY